MYQLDELTCREYKISSTKEWILTNSIGGFSMGTPSGVNTRRYHGHLVAAIEPPTKRMVLLTDIEAYIETENSRIEFSCHQYPGAIHPEGYKYLKSFSVGDYAEWCYEADNLKLSKRLALHNGENTVTVQYENTSNQTFNLILRPLVSHKFYHSNFKFSADYPQLIEHLQNKTLLEHEGISLFLNHNEALCTPLCEWYYQFEHQKEMERGLDFIDDLFCPCELKYELKPGQKINIITSTQDSNTPYVFNTMKKDESLTNLLKKAASNFFIKCENRTSIIAGYPWFTDWGRDTMISLPGICLCTGRIEEAKDIILAYASQMKQGLIPNRFTDQGEEPEYNTVDGTLWFVNAIYKTLNINWDDKFAEECMVALEEIFRWHVKGTLYGIKVDPEDGLLTQGIPGVQLTWMDAKIGDWVVTPRHGKAIEICGLWINSLRIMEWMSKKLKKNPEEYVKMAELAESNFEKKFWEENLGYYLDVAEPNDATLRPNQLIAMSLPFAPAIGKNACKALNKITQELLTPVGMRTLSPNHPNYVRYYRGSMRELDASYHQGTVWPWLIGPYISALMKLTGNKEEAEKILRRCINALEACGLGGITEVYDAEEPRQAGGCPWQAWSVAEVLRSWVEDLQMN